MSTAEELMTRLDEVKAEARIAELEAEIVAEERRVERARLRAAAARRTPLGDRVRPVDARRFAELVGCEWLEAADRLVSGTASGDVLAGMAWMARRVEDPDWDDWEWAQKEEMGSWATALTSGMGLEDSSTRPF